MEYMLVLQWPSSSTAGELDLLLSLEDEITDEIGDFGTVDGHDIGAGEMNIFIFTENPKVTFEHIKKINAIANHVASLKAGYREVGEDEYVPLHREGLEKFFVA
jgi:hypothetical protein